MTTKIEDRLPDDTDFQAGEPLRWRAVITFYTDDGSVSDVQTFDEIEELHEIVEQGPNFYAIREIVVTINPAFLSSRPGLKTTLECSGRE